MMRISFKSKAAPLFELMMPECIGIDLNNTQRPEAVHANPIACFAKIEPKIAARPRRQLCKRFVGAEDGLCGQGAVLALLNGEAKNVKQQIGRKRIKHQSRRQEPTRDLDTRLAIRPSLKTLIDPTDWEKSGAALRRIFRRATSTPD